MFCPACFVEMKENRPLDKPGYVYTYTTVNRNRTGAISEPVIIALIKFEGVKGGIVHRLDVDVVEKVSFGMKVAPALKEPGDRTGALTDILAFRAL